VAVNLDVNRGLENEKTGKFFRWWVIFFLLFVASIVIYALLSGKHHKIGLNGIETNINDSLKKDSTFIINNDHSIHAGRDVIERDKIEYSKDTNKH